MMTKEEIFQIARAQSAVEMNCRADDFLCDENVCTAFALGEGARKYLTLPISANIVSYGRNAVASATDDCRAVVEEYLAKFPFVHLFETPNLHWLEERLATLGHKICFMAEYFLPEPDAVVALPSRYPLRVLSSAEFADLYRPEWSNALCKKRKELDVLGVGAYDGDRLVGLAACSADGEQMWQIGVDVLPTYRHQGVAKALTSRLAVEILQRGKVPFYCAAWSNICSVRNAIACGFRPAWVEMTVKPTSTVDAMNA